MVELLDACAAGRVFVSGVWAYLEGTGGDQIQDKESNDEDSGGMSRDRSNTQTKETRKS